MQYFKNKPCILFGLIGLIFGCEGNLNDSFGQSCSSNTDCSGSDTCDDTGHCATCTCESGEVCNSDGSCPDDNTFQSCSPSCSSDEICSITGECIAEGTCNKTSDCTETGLVCDESSHECVPGSECGAQEFSTDVVPPNLMIVLDRSPSMYDPVPGSDLNRWETAAQAITTLTTTYDGKINFGLILFSACLEGGCSIDGAAADIGTDVSTINNIIETTDPCPDDNNDPQTPIAAALEQCIDYSGLTSTERENAVLLITDGRDNCGGGGADIAAQLLAQDPSVPVYVVGFSGDVDADELTSISDAAGTSPYYQADDLTQLEDALGNIAGIVGSCTVSLNGTPEGDIYVFFNNDETAIENDSTNGWTYDAATNTVTFHGDACDDIKNGTVTDIDVVFGCESPTPD